MGREHEYAHVQGDYDENRATASVDHSRISGSTAERGEESWCERGRVGAHTLRRLVRGRGEVVAELAAQFRKEVRRARSSLRSSLAEADAMLEELRTQRERRRSTEHA